MADSMKVALMAGILILGTAVLVPTLIDSTNSDAEDAREVSVGTQAELTDVLWLTVESTNTSENTTNNATVTYTDSRTLESNTTVTDEGNTTTVELSGETVTYEPRVVGNDSVLLVTTYDPKFGWNDGANTFWSNLGIVLAIAGFMAVVGIIIKVLP